MAPGMLFRTQARQKRRSDPVTPRGLVNLGNTCYLNAVVQALAHCTSFASRLVGDAAMLEGGDNDAKVSRAFAHICSALSDRGRHSAVRPAELIGAIQARRPSFGGFQQQDAHELLRILLDGLHMHLQRHWAAQQQPEEQSSGVDRMVVDDAECVLTDDPAAPLPPEAEEDEDEPRPGSPPALRPPPPALHVPEAAALPEWELLSPLGLAPTRSPLSGPAAAAGPLAPLAPLSPRPPPSPAERALSPAAGGGGSRATSTPASRPSTAPTRRSRPEEEKHGAGRPA